MKEQGVTFAIVIVKPRILQSQFESQRASQACSGHFPGLPIVLMAQDSREVPTYWGRKDIVNFLARLHVSLIPWKEYTFND